MRNAQCIGIAACFLFWGRPCLGGSGAEPLTFLNLDANARPVALGGAYTALAADVNALLYNPAGLARVRRHEATFMHNAYFQEIKQEYVAYLHPAGWSLSLNQLSFGDVQKTTLSDPGGASLGQTTLSDLALGAGYGHALTESLAVGAGLKYIRETIDSTNGDGIAADLGVLYALPAAPGLNLGLTAQNLGPAVRFQGADENLPFQVRMGAAYAGMLAGRASVLALDVIAPRSESPFPRVGVETRLADFLALRMGYDGRNEAGPGITAGFGYLFKRGSVDYAIVPMGELGSAHRISVTFHWDTHAESIDQSISLPPQNWAK